MPVKTLTYVDASVLINASRGDKLETRLRALRVLGDKRREFIASEFLRLETLPQAVAFQRRKEEVYLKRFFERSVTVWVEDETALFVPAARLIEQHRMQLLDALHLAAAMMFKAEFVTAEKPTKPFFAAYANCASIYSG